MCKLNRNIDSTTVWTRANKGESVYPSDSDEEGLYAQGSLNPGEVFRDYDWETDRFVEYRSSFIEKGGETEIHNYFLANLWY